MKANFGRFILPATVAGCLLSTGSPTDAATVTLNPRAMATIGIIDPVYQSYNVEMVSVIGGDWWTPYDRMASAPASGASTASGISNAAFSKRPPLDLADPRLRRLAAALSPAYMRVSDKWANSTYFQIDGPPSPPPAGFDSVVTASQWKGVVDFSKNVGANLMTSFAISSGVRSADGAWTPSEAAKVLTYTAGLGGKIAAAEFFNEPNLAVIEGAPKGYSVSEYGRDFKNFEGYLRSQSPDTLIFGPGSVGELRGFAKLPGALKSEDMLRTSGGRLDGVSYHFYGAFSQRCQSMGAQFLVAPTAALSQAWLAASLRDTRYYRLSRVARRVRTGQAPLADGDIAGGLRWRPLGGGFYRYLPLSQSIGLARQERRQRVDAQHIDRKRLRPDRRGDLAAPPRLLGRAPVAEACRHEGAGCG
jgi:heparanase 1